jgi:ATP-dependent DNA ligase
LHSKTAHIKDVNFIFDMYVHRSQKLRELTFIQRQALLFALFADKIIGEERDYFVLNSNTWLAKSFSSGLTKLFDSLTAKEDEGIVLKSPQIKLGSVATAQVKSRRPAKSYAF